MDSVEDWELRTPIAPPLTSLEGARVISLAGTSSQQELVMSDVRLNLSDTAAREQSETLLSDRELSAHTDTYTINTDLLEQIRETARGTGTRQKLKTKSLKHKWRNGLLLPPLYIIS